MFKREFASETRMRYVGFEGGETWTWYRFCGDDATAIQAKVRQTLGGQTLAEETHFTVRDSWKTIEEKHVPLPG